jgi:ABC-type multidrug transport system fused ATPase/permease subunit
MSRLTADLFDITELAHHGPEDIFISGVTIVGSLAIMFAIQWRLALVIAVILPVFFLVVWSCRKSMQAASAEVKRRTAVINGDIESGLSGIRTAKASANEMAELQKFDRSNDFSFCNPFGSSVLNPLFEASHDCYEVTRIRRLCFQNSPAACGPCDLVTTLRLSFSVFHVPWRSGDGRHSCGRS